jgi:hypothetical protein
LSEGRKRHLAFEETREGIEKTGLIDSAVEGGNDRGLTTQQTAGKLTWIIAKAATVRQSVAPEATQDF